MVRGSCPVLSPFPGCLSGSSELDWGSVELLRTYEVRFSDSRSALHPGFCLGWAHWVFHAMSFSDSLSRSGGVVSFAFVTGFVAKTQAPPLLLGLRASLYWPNQRETIAVGDCYILCRWSGVTWSAWAAHRQLCERFLFAAWRSMTEYRRPLSPSGSGCRCHGCAISRSRNVCFVSLELGVLVLSLRLFFVKNFAVILVGGHGCGFRAHPCEAT